jgi:predicted Zn-dependent protease with MMP-like domain
MFQVERETFEALVEEAVKELPDEFREQIANVEFIVEDRASDEDLARVRARPGATLLGIYRGVPLTRRGARYNWAVPDVIAIFQKPIEYMARGEDDLRARVRRVVRHEVAHYFGISDDRLREIDAY